MMTSVLHFSLIAQSDCARSWKPTPTPDEEAFASLKAGIDTLPAGVKMLVVTGQFYGQGASPANLELLARFFDKYPGYVDRVFLSVKGGTKPNTLEYDSTYAPSPTASAYC